MQQDTAILYYFHDPMCSWCWGFAASWKKLQQQLPATVQVKRVLGGLAADTDAVMPDWQQQQIRNNWVQIEKTIPGIRFNFDFWEKNVPRRSTYAACRAVIAARQQGETYELRMTEAIQQAYYQDAKNPSDDAVLLALAEPCGLQYRQFERDFYSLLTVRQLQQEIAMSREMFVESFPTLLLQHDNTVHPVNIDYCKAEPMLWQIRKILHQE